MTTEKRLFSTFLSYYLFLFDPYILLVYGVRMDTNIYPYGIALILPHLRSRSIFRRMVFISVDCEW